MRLRLIGLLFCCTLVTNLLLSQIIDFPDQNLKTALVQYDPKIDLNDNGEIDVSEAILVSELIMREKGIENLTGIENFVNLIHLDLIKNEITEFDARSLLNLEILNIAFNDISSLQVDNMSQLKELSTGESLISGLNLEGLDQLEVLLLGSSQFVHFDPPPLPKLEHLSIQYNLLETINLSRLGNLIKLDLLGNKITEIDLTPLVNVKEILLSDNDIEIFDVSQCPQLEVLYCYQNELKALDVTQNKELDYVWASYNNLTSIDLKSNTKLTQLSLSHNNITMIDLSNNPDIESLDLGNNFLDTIDIYHLDLTFLDLSFNKEWPFDLSLFPNLKRFDCTTCYIDSLDFSNNLKLKTVYLNKSFKYKHLDFSNCTELSRLYVSQSYNLEYLNIKNNSIERDIYFEDCTNLEFICADNEDLPTVELSISENDLNTSVGSICPDVDEELYAVQWSSFYDVDQNDCQSNASEWMHMPLIIANDENAYIHFTSNGYESELPEGNYQLYSNFEHKSLFNIVPDSIDFSLSANDPSFEQDFCISTNEVFNDLEVLIIPYGSAIPGFESAYKLKVRNIGSTPMEGLVELRYLNIYLDFVSSDISPSSMENNLIKWELEDLLPFEETCIEFSMKLNLPTGAFALMSGDVLKFRATVVPDVIDDQLDNNSFFLCQEVLNAWDPNDITCLEGESLDIKNVGQFVHYMIRFENTGTAPAMGIEITNRVVTTKFDIQSLSILDSSHPMLVEVQNGNNLIFKFPDIQLPFDEEKNKGYLVYKIRTQERLVGGQQFSNQAEIYFDFNPAVITNKYITYVTEYIDGDEDGFIFEEDCDDQNANINPLATEIANNDIDEDCDGEILTHIDALDASVASLFPNPANDILYVETNAFYSYSIYNFQHQNLTNGSLVEGINQINIKNLKAGLYLLVLEKSSAVLTQKFLKME